MGRPSHDTLQVRTPLSSWAVVVARGTGLLGEHFPVDQITES
jgi:hypothetical protein